MKIFFAINNQRSLTSLLVNSLFLLIALILPLGAHAHSVASESLENGNPEVAIGLSYEEDATIDDNGDAIEFLNEDQTVPEFTQENAAGGSVYICTGPKARRYHRSSHCSGLNRCSGSIISLSKSNASSRGYTPCQRCY